MLHGGKTLGYPGPPACGAPSAIEALPGMDPSQLPLRDWHSPAMVGWWPPAPGWWIVFVFGILLLAAVLWSWRRFTRPSVKKLAKRELERLRSDPERPDWLLRLARLCAMQGRPAEADGALRAVLSLDPGNAFAQAELRALRP